MRSVGIFIVAATPFFAAAQDGAFHEAIGRVEKGFADRKSSPQDRLTALREFGWRISESKEAWAARTLSSPSSELGRHGGAGAGESDANPGGAARDDSWQARCNSYSRSRTRPSKALRQLSA